MAQQKNQFVNDKKLYVFNVQPWKSICSSDNRVYTLKDEIRASFPQDILVTAARMFVTILSYENDIQFHDKVVHTMLVEERNFERDLNIICSYMSNQIKHNLSECEKDGKRGGVDGGNGGSLNEEDKMLLHGLGQVLFNKDFFNNVMTLFEEEIILNDRFNDPINAKKRRIVFGKNMTLPKIVRRLWEEIDCYIYIHPFTFTVQNLLALSIQIYLLNTAADMIAVEENVDSEETTTTTETVSSTTTAANDGAAPATTNTMKTLIENFYSEHFGKEEILKKERLLKENLICNRLGTFVKFWIMCDVKVDLKRTKRILDGILPDNKKSYIFKRINTLLKTNYQTQAFVSNFKNRTPYEWIKLKNFISKHCIQRKNYNLLGDINRTVMEILFEWYNDNNNNNSKNNDCAKKGCETFVTDLSCWCFILSMYKNEINYPLNRDVLAYSTVLLLENLLLTSNGNSGGSSSSSNFGNDECASSNCGGGGGGDSILNNSWNQQNTLELTEHVFNMIENTPGEAICKETVMFWLKNKYTIKLFNLALNVANSIDKNKTLKKFVIKG